MPSLKGCLYLIIVDDRGQSKTSRKTAVAALNLVIMPPFPLKAPLPADLEIVALDVDGNVLFLHFRQVRLYHKHFRRFIYIDDGDPSY